VLLWLKGTLILQLPLLHRDAVIALEVFVLRNIAAFGAPQGAAAMPAWPGPQAATCSTDG